MQTFCNELPSFVAHVMRQRANIGIFNGQATLEGLQLLHNCTGLHLQAGTKLIFARESGYHSGGWWKNPDYERCFHLSLSFVDVIGGALRPMDKKSSQMWLNAFFSPDDQKKLWIEPPVTADGKAHDIWHYRLFCDEHWQPIIPRGEVYGKQFTGVGWKSFSEIYGQAKEGE